MPYIDSITIAQAAELSGRSISSIEKLAREGKLASEKIGRNYLVRKRHVEQLAPISKRGRPRKISHRH